MQAITLVFIQFGSLAVLGLTALETDLSDSVIFLLSSGILLGLWALYAMRTSVITVSPNLDEDATLVTTGPYAIIRHPMYAGLLLFGLGLLLIQPSLIRSLAFIVLTINQLFKINYEERQLKESLKGYQEYADRVSRIIPFIY